MDASLVVLLAAIALSAVGLTCILGPSRGPRGTAAGLWGLVEVGVGLFLMLGMLYAAAIQVVVRYALSDYLTVPWTEEFARLLLVWAAMWGAMLIQRSDEHISVAIFFDLLPSRAQRVARVLGDLVVLAFLAVVVWYGWLAAQVQMGQTTITLGLPIAAFAYSVPLGGALMMVYTVGLLIRRLQGKPLRHAIVPEI